MKKTTKRKTPPARPGEVDLRFATVAEAFTHHTNVTLGKIMASQSLRVSGKIFAMFPRGEFVVKLPQAQVDELVRAGKGRRFDPGHGRLMKEWVVVAEGKADWIELAEQAYQFVKSG